MSEHSDENLLKDNIHIDDLCSDQSNQNITNLNRLLYKYSIDKLRSICNDDSEFNMVVQELSKLLLKVMPNFHERDTKETDQYITLPEKIELITIKPYMTSKWIRISQSFLKEYNKPIKDLHGVYSKWLEDLERVCDEEQFNQHKKCVSLLRELVYKIQTIGYVVDEATVAMKIYDIYKLITIMIKNGVLPPLELLYGVLGRYSVPVH